MYITSPGVVSLITASLYLYTLYVPVLLFSQISFVVPTSSICLSQVLKIIACFSKDKPLRLLKILYCQSTFGR